MDITHIVANNVKGYRKLRELSQEKLAELAELHRIYPGYIERGRVNVSVKVLAKIAKALKIEPYKLLIKDSYKEKK